MYKTTVPIYFIQEKKQCYSSIKLNLVDISF